MKSSTEMMCCFFCEHKINKDSKAQECVPMKHKGSRTQRKLLYIQRLTY